jgi:hypothetical protein
MCEFCVAHGEGEKWYSDNLLSDVLRRKCIEEFVSEVDHLGRTCERLVKLATAPRFIKSIIGRIVTKRMKKQHFGQVVPIEEIARIFNFVIPFQILLVTPGWSW